VRAYDTEKEIFILPLARALTPALSQREREFVTHKAIL
jgi:hypothetical protein